LRTSAIKGWADNPTPPAKVHTLANPTTNKRAAAHCSEANRSKKKSRSPDKDPRLPATYYQLVMMMAMLMMASMMVMFFVSGGIVRAHHRRCRCDSQHHRHKASHHKDKYSAARAFHYTSLLSSSRLLLRTRIYVENTYLDCLGC
jgi:hypothetical protein